jgi:hypothetical protein
VNKDPAWIVLTAALSGCGASSGSATAPDASPPGVDAGSEAGEGGVPGTVTVTGSDVQFTNLAKPVPSATISMGGTSTTANAMGDWSLVIHANTPVTQVHDAPGYVQFTNQEEIFSADTAYGATILVDIPTANILLQSFRDFDKSLGVLAIGVTAESACTSTVAGSTITVTAGGKTTHEDAGGGPGLIYFVGGFPSPTATSVAAGEVPSAIAYNLPVGVDLAVTVSHPKCKQDLFPVTVGPITYTGKVLAGAAITSPTKLATSYITAFLK